MNNSSFFTDDSDQFTTATLGWQDNTNALWGIKTGFKESADILVDFAIAEGEKNNIAVLDTFIFPVFYLYRHSIEVSLKLIYFQFFRKIPKGSHNLSILWELVNDEVINVVEGEDFLEGVKERKEKFHKWDLSSIKSIEITKFINEIQKIDPTSGTFRYLMNNA